MEKVKVILKSYQQPIVLLIGYLLVAVMAFGLGRITHKPNQAPEVKIEETAVAPINYNPTVSGIQSDLASGSANCSGKIKATISSKIYHIPGQAGYDKLNSQTCFETEVAAQAAGYRKALK